MWRYATIAALIGTGIVACVDSGTGIQSRACERARVEGRESADRLEAAMRIGGDLGPLVNRVERATAEMQRACETRDASPPPQEIITSSAPETPSSSNVFYVIVEVTDERTTPGGGVVENRIYRGQLVEVTDRRGEWVRVTGLQYSPRWVRASHLSRERPAPRPQPQLATDLIDARIQGIPAVGEEGHREADVRALRTGAAHLLASGQCRRIEIGGKSVNREGVYWVNCGEDQNRFFTIRNGEPHFCGRNASSC